MIMLIRLGRNGEKIWSREIPQVFRIASELPALARSRSNEYYLGGSGDTTNLHPGYDGRLAFIIKTDSNGQQLWRKIYIGNFHSNQTIRDFIALEDGSLMACGQGNGHSYPDPGWNTGEDGCLWKIAPDGDVIWQRNFGFDGKGDGITSHEPDEFYSMDRTRDGGFILAGQLRSGPATDDSTLSAYLVKVDSNGMQQWWRSYRFESTDRFWKVKSASDGGYILVGESIWNNFASRNLYLMKTDSLGFCEGITSVGSPAPVSISLDTPYPHPLAAQGSGTVRYTLAQASNLRLSLHDALGREARVLASGFTDAGEHIASVESGGLAPGLYLLRLLAGGQAVQKTVIVTR
ncbi:MAG: T9SS type A sorting domain-containing protein [Ignavibacteria bacterium]|nr:T9SS type A sorting domain-containing protein [Ignavibacteria bacterium]